VDRASSQKSLWQTVKTSYVDGRWKAIVLHPVILLLVGAPHEAETRQIAAGLDGGDRDLSLVRHTRNCIGATAPIIEVARF
jgi:hypothetical protein